jgi:hypothetical protein
MIFIQHTEDRNHCDSKSERHLSRQRNGNEHRSGGKKCARRKEYDMHNLVCFWHIDLRKVTAGLRRKPRDQSHPRNDCKPEQDGTPSSSTRCGSAIFQLVEPLVGHECGQVSSPVAAFCNWFFAPVPRIFSQTGWRHESGHTG